MSSIRLDNAASIRTAADIRDRLVAAVADQGEILVDCTAVDEIDVTFLQLLIAATRSAAANGVSLHLAPPPAGLAALAERAGLALPRGLLPA